MKRNRIYVLLLAIVCLLAGCDQIDPMDEDAGDCKVSLNLVGEIMTSDSPMTKATTDDLYIVQIFSGTNKFAAGLFDDQEKIRFNLKKGSTYRIIVVVLKNGKVLLTDGNSRPGYRSDINSVLSNSLLDIGARYTNAVGFYYPINTNYYNSIGELKGYAWNNSTLIYNNSSSYYYSNIGKGVLSTRYPQCDDWFYGEINGYSPIGEYETLNMDLRRVGFKLKYELSGVTDGEVSVKVYNSEKTFIDETISTTTYASESLFYAFYDTHAAWQYADDYTENMTLAVSWYRGIGVTEDYGTKTIQIKRNCLNNIKIQMTSSDQSAGMNLTVEAESTIGSENVTIPVQ